MRQPLHEFGDLTLFRLIPPERRSGFEAWEIGWLIRLSGPHPKRGNYGQRLAVQRPFGSGLSEESGNNRMARCLKWTGPAAHP